MAPTQLLQIHRVVGRVSSSSLSCVALPPQHFSSDVMQFMVMESSSIHSVDQSFSSSEQIVSKDHYAAYSVVSVIVQGNLAQNNILISLLQLLESRDYLH